MSLTTHGDTMLSHLFQLAYSRTTKPVTLSSLAAATGVARVTLSRWLNGHSEPERGDFFTVLRALAWDLALVATDATAKRVVFEHQGDLLWRQLSRALKASGWKLALVPIEKDDS